MKTVLIVDDEEDIDQLIVQKFRKEIKNQTLGFMFARDGKNALELLETSSVIDLVITDINMPTMNGIELLMKIKSRYPSTRVLMMSAYTDQSNTNLAKNAGADGFITKPIDLKYLEELLTAALREDTPPSA